MIRSQVTEQVEISQVVSAHKEELSVLPALEAAEQRTNAALYRCDNCQAWWGTSEPNTIGAHLVFRMAEPHTDLFLWEDYRGWRDAAEADICPECGVRADAPSFSLKLGGGDGPSPLRQKTQ